MATWRDKSDDAAFLMVTVLRAIERGDETKEWYRDALLRIFNTGIEFNNKRYVQLIRECMDDIESEYAGMAWRKAESDLGEDEEDEGLITE